MKHFLIGQNWENVLNNRDIKKVIKLIQENLIKVMVVDYAKWQT